MTFKEIAAQFEAAESGTDSFKRLYKDAFHLAESAMDNAGSYFVIATIAQAYVRRYEDEAVPVDQANRAKALLMRFNAKIVEGLNSDAATHLRLLGEVANEYQAQIHDF
ncbi:MAG: hypothetical protein JWN73_743 [Betaproteobacteria bacterium]|nr:hypothetical protein [Betaproteobacteria bacterium]